MGVQSPGYRCRHVVFTAARPGRPLNLGARPAQMPAAEIAARETAQPESGRATDDDAFVGWLFSRAGLDARAYRRSSLRRRVPACLRALRVKTTADARRAVRLSPGLVPVAVGSLLIGVTSFFRDAAVFGLMFRQLLPALADTGRRLRVWGAACSDGAELYSVAMLLAELNVLHRCELLGTDCRGEAVARAAAGAYDAAACRTIPAELRGRYTEAGTTSRGGGGVVGVVVGGDLTRLVRPWLREAVAWRCADVLDDVERGPWDLILCRNLAMYLRPAAAGRLWRALAAELRPGGLLVVGKAERPAGVPGLAAAGPCVYRRGARP